MDASLRSIFQLTNTGDFSIYLNFLSYLSSVFCNFQHMTSTYMLLSLHLSILFSHSDYECFFSLQILITCFLFAHRYDCFFSLFTLHLIILLKSLTSSKIFYASFLESYTQKIMLPASKDDLLFHRNMPFIDVSHFTAVDRLIKVGMDILHNFGDW